MIDYPKELLLYLISIGSETKIEKFLICLKITIIHPLHHCMLILIAFLMKIIIFQNKDIPRTFTFVECYFENLWFVDILTSYLAIMVIIIPPPPPKQKQKQNPRIFHCSSYSPYTEHIETHP